MKILATDGIAPKGKEALEALGHQVFTDYLEPDELAKQVQEADCLIVRSATKVRQPIIDAAAKTGRLKLVVRAGVGVDNIDCDYAASKGLAVRNTPKASTNAMSELALAHLFAISRFVATGNVEMRQGVWNKAAYKGVELAGSKLGIVGFGRTARQLAQKCAGLGMIVSYYDVLGEDPDSPYTYLPLKDLLAQSDFISLHIPATADGKPIIGAEDIASMKPGVRLVNCARGGLIDEDALLQALNTGQVAAAALDVFLVEPAANSQLVNHPNVSATPHIGAQTYQAQDRIGEELVEVITDFFDQLN